MKKAITSTMVELAAVETVMEVGQLWRAVVEDKINKEQTFNSAYVKRYEIICFLGERNDHHGKFQEPDNMVVMDERGVCEMISCARFAKHHVYDSKGLS